MTGKEALQVSGVVVNFNAGAALAACVASLRDEGITSIVVVDNGSTDNSLELLGKKARDVEIIRGHNLGFGGGVNRGARAGGGELLLVCNPDVVLQPGAVTAMVARLKADPKVGLVGPALLTTNGEVRPSARAFPTIRRSSWQAFAGVALPQGRSASRYREANRRAAEGGIVDWVTGACFLVRRSAFDAVGGFDEGYFMYVEEVDLCWRLKRAGWRVSYEPAARVVHIGGVSASAHPYRMITAHHRSLWRFARRDGEQHRLALPFVMAGVAGRWGFVMMRRFASDLAAELRARRRPRQVNQ